MKISSRYAGEKRIIRCTKVNAAYQPCSVIVRNSWRQNFIQIDDFPTKRRISQKRAGRVLALSVYTYICIKS